MTPIQLPPAIRLNPRLVVIAVIRKLRTRSDLPILRTTRIPPASTNGSMGALPTHQLADWLRLK